VDPSTHITQYGHSVWRLGQEGLEGTPLSIAQTTDGYIWIGTTNGLFRFDGVRFMPWVPQSGEQLDGSFIANLLGASDGSLYIGTFDGLARIRNGHVYHYRTSLLHPGPFFEDSQGSIWMGDRWNFTDHNTLCKVGEYALSCLGTKDGFSCVYGSAVSSDRAGSVWIGSKEGICHWQRGKKPENFPLPYLSRADAGLNWVDALASTKAGALWAGISLQGKGYGLLKFSAGRWQNYITQDVDGTKLPVSSLMSDSHDSLWIGTKGQGVYKLNAGKLGRFDTADGLSGNIIEKTMEDREGDIWVITNRGVDMFRDISVISYSSRDGLLYDKTTAVSAQSDGTVWIGTTGALVRFNNGVFSSITHKNGLPTSGVHYLFTDSKDQLWVGGGQELYLYKDEHYVNVTDQNSKDVGYAQYIVEDRHHHLWVTAQDLKTGRSFLYRLEGSRIVEKFDLFVPTGGESPSSLAADPRGGLYVEESQHGIFRFQDGKFVRLDTGGYKGQISMMSSDPDGALWVVTMQAGLLRYKDGKAEYLTKMNGLPCNAGVAVIDDHAGNHWFYMSCGIVKISDSELAEWWKNPAYRVTARVFNDLDGAEPRLSGDSPTMTPDGRIWSENRAYLNVIDPRHLPYNRLAPPVNVEKMVVDHREYSPSGTPLLPNSPQEVEIDYSALSYVVPERVKFRYRLSGYDTHWTDAGTRRQAFYNDLSPGRYTFQVVACNNDGVWNESGASFSFAIPPAWYQTLWFRAFCGLLITLIAYAVYQSRLRRYAALLKARFDERIEERTRLARDLHDTLLQTLQGSKLVADNALENPTDPAGMRKALDLVSQWLERATLEGRAALNSLRSSATETNDLAAALRDAAENCRLGSSVKIDFVLNGTSRDMHPIVREEIYRIGCEAINNACVHSGANVVTIELTYTHDLHLSIRDDGKGIDEAILRVGKKGHFGLRGMRERADRVGAKLSWKTTPNGGTEVTLLVPGIVLFKTYDLLK
jgi:signal transduction histidine kinase/ligand-binding sensor domain-containing protein